MMKKKLDNYGTLIVPRNRGITHQFNKNTKSFLQTIKKKCKMCATNYIIDNFKLIK